MEFDLNMTDELLATTRAVRKRLDLTKPVPRDIINECLELAVQAPTGSNSQGWRWVVVDDPDQRQALAELYKRGGSEYLGCLLYTSPSPRDQRGSRMPSSA